MQKIDFEAKKADIANIAKKHGLNLVVLFGSQATGRVHEKSDIDIAILGKQAVDFDTQTKIWGEFSRVFNRDDIEVVDIGTASPTLMRMVVEDGLLLFEATADGFFEWKLYALTVWMDSAWLRDLRNRKLHEWVTNA